MKPIVLRKGENSMLASEFMTNNNDILLGLVSEEEFQKLNDGNVVFVITVAPGQKDIVTRAVRSAGYFLTVSGKTNPMGKKTDVCLVGLTAGGYAKVDHINLDDIGGRGNKIVLKCKPLPDNDPRRHHRFV
jgi:hypothetical protein